ncbi:MAG: trehalose 6-phosphate synthase [Acidimicrobiaceae bacterium]
MQRPVVILSNRGPLSFHREDDGELVAKRGAGGLVSGLAPLVADTDAMWLAAAMSDADRAAAAQGVVEAAGLRVRLLDIDAETHRLAYDVVCNATLWFCFHGLFDRARSPVIDRRWRDAWQAYRDVNDAFVTAAAEAAPEGAAILVQDYHLALVGRALAQRRPDVRTVYFSHTPFCVADGLRVLPDDVVVELLEGIAGHHAVGFHTRRWADAFKDCCRTYLGRDDATTFVSPLGADPDDLAATAASDACAIERDALSRVVGDRKLLVRVDRIELSKNVLRGLLAYDDLLERHPEWREHVVFAALLYPSREGLEEYAVYRDEVDALVAKVNDRWSTPTWSPILFDPDDNFPRSVAALQLADAVLVNPISDGLNLVAKEQALLSTRDAALVLSTEAGVWDELRDAGAIGVNPFDVAATSDALHLALSMPADERRARHEAMREAALARTPRHWLADHLTAAG